MTHAEGPDDGHTFRFSVTSRMASKVVGEAHNTDADWWSEPWTIEVRAFSLNAALRKAAELPLTAWEMPKEEEDGNS